MVEVLKQEFKELKDSVIELQGSIKESNREYQEMKKSLDKMHITLFGTDDSPGIVSRIDSILKIADAIKSVLTKILISICVSAVTIIAPHFIRWLASMMAPH